MFERKGKFVGHIPCTNPNCGSSDAMAVYLQDDGTRDATCFACRHFERLDSSEQNSQPRVENSNNIEHLLKVDACSKLPVSGLYDRGISKDTCLFYGVRCALSGADGITPLSHFYPYHRDGKLVGYKKRTIADKQFICVGDMKDVDLFGQHLFEQGGNKLYITEGECDALALFQVFKDLAGTEFKHLNPSVVSLPNGATNAASILASKKSFLDKFKEVVLVFDQDDPGQKATLQAFSVLDPTRTRVARLTEKDANAMLLSNKSSELKWSCLNAQPYTPSGISTVSDFISDAIRPPHINPTWPWPTLTKLTYGRSQALYGIGAGVGIGKTEFFHELAYHIIHEQNSPVGLFLLEEAPVRTIRILGGRVLGIPAHKPDVKIDQEELRQAIESFSGKIFIFDHKGERSWTTILAQIKSIIIGQEVKDIFIDPLTAVISHEENTDRALHSIMDDLSRLTHDPYNARIYYSSHLNEPPRDRTPHEEGGRVTESQFAGSRAMVRYSDYIIALERNKQDIDPILRNTSTVRILKDRKYGHATGETFQIYYDHRTGRYLEQHIEF